MPDGDKPGLPSQGPTLESLHRTGAPIGFDHGPATSGQHYLSFGRLADELARTAHQTFVHHWEDPSYMSQLPAWVRRTGSTWDFPGAAGKSIAPKYLYRGEPGVFRSTLPSRARISKLFDSDDLKLIDELTSMASWAWRLREADAFRSVGWPQHYGFPTNALSPALPTPSGLLSGVPTGGPPNTQRWLFAGDECEVQWRYPFPGPMPT